MPTAFYQGQCYFQAIQATDGVQEVLVHTGQCFNVAMGGWIVYL